MASLSPAPPVRATILAENSLLLFELIVGDLHWSAMQVGAVAMMASAAVADENKAGFALIHHLILDDAHVMRLALRFAVGPDLSPDHRNRLDRTYADIQQAMAQLKSYTRLESLNPLQLGLIRRLLPDLRRVALRTAETISQVEPLYRTRIKPDFASDAAIIRQFLGRAARGERGEVAHDGSVRLPPLRQRRKSPRLSVQRPCWLALPGGEVEATLVNVSRESLGLRCQTQVSRDQRVVVVIDDRRLEATVLRVEGEWIGLRLARPLLICDPLFMTG